MVIDTSVIVGIICTLTTGLIMYFWKRYVSKNDALEQKVEKMQLDAFKVEIEAMKKKLALLQKAIMNHRHDEEGDPTVGGELYD